VTPDGRRQLEEILARTYAALPHVRNLGQTEIAPHWRGQSIPPRRVGFWAPLALAATAAAGALLAIFIVLRLVLVETGQPASAAIRAINPSEPLRLSRVAPPPAPATSDQLERLRAFLAPEIAQHLVAVDQDPQAIRVRTTVGQLFRSGSDAIEPGRQALFERIGSAIEQEKGPVRVEGHADSDRLASLTFPDNFALSKARAETVANILRSKLTDPGRVSAQGYGDSQPIAPNGTAEGKSLNRRVEVVLQRSPGP
jgi:type VI secretion system protein ImpK